MDKQLIEKIAREVACEVDPAGRYLPYPSTTAEFAAAFLARIDAERGKEAVLFQYRMRPDWQDQWGQWSDCSIGSHEDYMKVQRNGDWHYETRKLFLSAPTIPEGMALVPIEPTSEMIDAADYQFKGPRSDFVEIYAAMIAAAQGEK